MWGKETLFPWLVHMQGLTCIKGLRGQQTISMTFEYWMLKYPFQMWGKETLFPWLVHMQGLTCIKGLRGQQTISMTFEYDMWYVGTEQHTSNPCICCAICSQGGTAYETPLLYPPEQRMYRLDQKLYKWAPPLLFFSSPLVIFHILPGNILLTPLRSSRFSQVGWHTVLCSWSALTHSNSQKSQIKSFLLKTTTVCDAKRTSKP